MAQQPLSSIHSKDIRASGVDSISLDEMGLLSDSKGGLGYDLWQNSDREFIEKLLILLPRTMENNIGAELKKLLLMTIAAPPGAGIEKHSLFKLKLRHLALMKEHDNIEKMIKLIPQNLLDEEIERIYTSSFFVVFGFDNGCKKVKERILHYNLPFWRKAAIFCQTYTGDIAAADLGLNLAKEDGIDFGEDFTMLIKKLQGKKEEKEESKKIWHDFIVAELEQFPDIQILNPEIKYTSDVIINGKIMLWWQKIKNEENSSNLLLEQNLIADALGNKLSTAELNKLALYAISSFAPASTPTHNTILLQQLHASLQANKKGEAIIMLLFLLNIAPNNMPANIAIEITQILSQLGLKDKAQQFALIALGV